MVLSIQTNLIPFILRNGIYLSCIYTYVVDNSIKIKKKGIKSQALYIVVIKHADYQKSNYCTAVIARRYFAVSETVRRAGEGG